MGGRPVYVVGIGAPSAPATLDAAPGVLVVCFQHGMEPAPREAAFQLARDLAYTTDPTLVAYLTTRPVWIMPSANPDRAPYTDLASGGRNNLDGIDMNRDHIALTAQETVAIHDAVTAIAPELIIDVHEGASDPNDIEVGAPTNTQVPALARSWSDAMVSTVLADLTTGGYVAGPWSSYEWPGMFRNASGLRHAVSFIIETRTQNRTTQFRIDAAADAILSGLGYHHANAAAITADLAAGRAQARADGAAGAPVKFTGDGAPTVTLDPAPTSYRLTTAQRDALAVHLAAFDIDTPVVDGNGWRVTMDQDAATLIPYVMDEHSPDRTVTAERVYPPPPAPERDLPPTAAFAGLWGPIHAHRADRTVTSVHLMTGGQLIPLVSTST